MVLEYQFVEYDLGCEQQKEARIQVAQMEFADTDFERVDGRLRLSATDLAASSVESELQLAEQLGSNLLLFPELCVPGELIETIVKWSVGRNCLVVAGTHYEKDGTTNADVSVCPIIFEGQVFTQRKSSVAPSEQSIISGLGVQGSPEFPIFKSTPLGTFANFVCSDYLNPGLKTRVLEQEIDFASVVAFQRDSRVYLERFNIDVDESRDGLYLAYCNCRVEPLTDGESSLFAVFDRKLYRDDTQDHQVARPDFLNMVCSFGSKVGLICDVSMKNKRPKMGRNYATSPNVMISRRDSLFKPNSAGVASVSQKPLDVTPNNEQQSNASFFDPTNHLIAQIHNALDEFRKELFVRVHADPVTTDAHSVAGDFAVRLSQAVYYDNGSTAIFKANESRTNIQRAELLSLLTIHTVATQHKDLIGVDVPLQFFSTNELREALSNTWVSLVPDKETFEQFMNADDVYDTICQTILRAYCSLAVYSVVIDFFDCSAVIFPAPGLAIDFETLLRQSGYIHSIGRTIYLRNVRKTSVAEITSNIKNHIGEEVIDGAWKVPFCLYCNEIFDEFQTTQETEDVTGGIDELKFRSEKFFFGGRPIYSFRDALLSDPEIAKHIEFIGSGSSYHEQISSIPNRAPGTIWLFRDRKQDPFTENFFICYRQEMVNDDTFLQADEDKPAWLGPVTLPQSLASAMLSLARPYFGLDASPVIVDPFLGSGTTLFESFKMFSEPEFWGGDLNSSTKQAVFDNAALLTGERSFLKELLDEVEDVLRDENGVVSRESFSKSYGKFIQGGETLYELQASPRDPTADVFLQCQEFVSSVLSRQRKDDGSRIDPHRAVRFLSSSNVGDIFERFEGGASLQQRVLIYCYWKATLRNSSAFLEGRRKAPDKVFQEIKNFLSFMRRIEQGIRSRQISDSEDAELLFSTGVHAETEQLADFLNSKSDQIICGDEDGELSKFFQNIPNHVREKGVDIFITDPPYGFNTDHEDSRDLFNLYEHLIHQIVAHVGTETHLLICLPEESHNGQVLPSFVTKSWFLPRLLQEASSKRIEIIEYSKIWPSAANSGKAPFYWRSDRALTRSILHVILRRVRR